MSEISCHVAELLNSVEQSEIWKHHLNSDTYRKAKCES